MSNKILTLRQKTIVDIADAIRNKIGSSELIKIEDLDDAIAAIDVAEGAGGIIDVEELPGHQPIPATDIEWDLDNDWDLIVNGDIVGCDGIYVNNLSNEEITQIVKTLVVDENSKYGDMAICDYEIWSRMLDENNEIIESNTGDPYLYIDCYNEWDRDENDEPIISDRYVINLEWGITNGSYYCYTWDNNNGWYGEYWSYSEESGYTMEWWTNEAPSYIDIKVPVLLSEFYWSSDDLYDQYGSISANEILTPLFYCKTSDEIQQDSIYRLPDGTMWMFVDDAWVQLGALDYQLKELNVTENGEYIPTEGIYYSKVNVEVPETLVGIVDIEELPCLRMPVPNSGYVEKVCFDTSLSIEQVVAELEKLTYSEYGDYPLLINDNIVLLALIQNGVYLIGDNTSGMLYFASEDPSGEGQFPVGWNPDFNGEIEVNAEVVNEMDGYPIGAENDKISNLFYLDKQGGSVDINPNVFYRTPDGKVWKYVDGAWIQWDTTPKLEYDAVEQKPITKTFKRVRLNTSLSIDEVLNIIRPITYTGTSYGGDYDACYFVCCTLNDEGYRQNILYLHNSGNRNEYYRIVLNYNELFNSDTGWNPNILDFVDEQGYIREQYIDGIPTQEDYEGSFNGAVIWLENDKLVDLVCEPTTSAKAISLRGNYTGEQVNITANGSVSVLRMLDRQALPTEITVDVLGSVEEYTGEVEILNLED